MNTFYTFAILLLLCTPAALSQNLAIPDANFIDMSAYRPGVYAVQLGEGIDREMFQVVKE